MTNSNGAVDATDVASSIFESFLQSLEAKKIDPVIIERLRKQLLESKVFTEGSLREAIFPLVDQL